MAIKNDPVVGLIMNRINVRWRAFPDGYFDRLIERVRVDGFGHMGIHSGLEAFFHF